MSAQEIIAELPKLQPEEFRLVKAKVDELARAQRRTIDDALPEVAGTAERLPKAPAFLRRVLERAKPRDWPADYALARLFHPLAANATRVLESQP